jgi:hypothetical protein
LLYPHGTPRGGRGIQMTKKNFEPKNILENKDKAISLADLQKGDLIQIEWSDASEVRARLSEHYESPEATVYEWGVFLGVSERKKRQYILLGKEVALPWKEWGAVRVPLDILDEIHIIKPEFCQVLPAGVLRKIRIRPARGYVFLRKLRLRETIRRALTKQIPNVQSYGKKIRINEEVPPSELLVLAIYFSMVALVLLTVIEALHIAFLHSFNSEVFAGITLIIGTILGAFFGAKA